MVTVFGQPGCVACKNTTRWLEKHDVSFTYRDITVDPIARDKVDELEYMSLPVVYVDEQTHWSGFDMEKLEEIRNGTDTL